MIDRADGLYKKAARPLVGLVSKARLCQAGGISARAKIKGVIWATLAETKNGALRKTGNFFQSYRRTAKARRVLLNPKNAAPAR